MYKITRTNKAVFGEEKFSNEYRRFRAKATETKEETEARFEKLKAKCNNKFRVLDDDGVVYFWGVATTNNNFQPLDDAECYGCTMIEYYNSEMKEWEEL